MSKNTSKPKGSKKLAPITWILIGVLSIMTILIIFMTVAVSSTTSKQARKNMQSVVGQKTNTIYQYAVWIEDTLDNFSYAGQIREYLMNPTDENLKIAQTLTEEFAEDVGYDSVEGLFIASWDGITRTHNNHETIGSPVREGERLDQLHDTLEGLYDQVYNGGMVISPSTGQQVIACYKAVRDDHGKAIGFVGIAVPTVNLLNDLSSLEIGGLENASYVLVNAADNKYLYNSEDNSVVGTVCEAADVQRIDAGVLSGSIEESGNAHYKNNNGGKTEVAYSMVPDYGWMLFMNAKQSEVLRMTYQMQIFVLVFGFLMLLLVGVFGLINAHQEKVNRKLGNQLARNEATKESLSTAMFKDLLTEVNNRVSFSMDLEKVKADADHPCYFAMVNVSEFSGINTLYGNDTGDAVLVNTAQILSEAFKDGGTVYRTGSDEFIVAIQKDDNSTASYNQVYRTLNEAHADLLRPQETPSGPLNVGYKIALVRKTDELSTAVITVLKDITNRGGRTNFGQIQFIDMDTL